MKKLQTEAIHGHVFYDEKFGVFIPPIYLSVIYEQFERTTGELRRTDRDLELKYSREENPTVRALERVFARLEKTMDSVAFNSGMGSISSTLYALVSSGETVLIPYESYGTTIQLLDDMGKYGVKVKKVFPSTEDIIENLSRDVSLVFIETMTNPTLKIIDVREVAKATRELGIKLVVDNTFASPVIFNPVDAGANVVLHSATKYIAGHNDVLGGFSATDDIELIREIWDWRKKLGTIIQPFDAYLILRGIKTLELRFRRHSENALAIAEFLQDHPKVIEVHYPGLKDSPYYSLACKMFSKKLFGGVVSFKIKGSMNDAKKVMLSTLIIKPSPSLGGTESLMTLPALSSAKYIPKEYREKVGITDNLLRLSVGLEDVNDIIEDLDRALSRI